MPRLILASFFSFVLAAAAQSPATYENFESAVPAGWQASGKIGLTGVRYKSGDKSLAWQWGKSGATLDCALPVKLPAKGNDRGFAVWVYNETPRKGAMRAEFVTGGKVVASCWFWMDFRGWAPLAASYAELGIKPDQPLDSLRFIAPGAAGRLFFDVAKFDIERISRGSKLLSLQTPWAGKKNLAQAPETLALSSAHPEQNRPWLPARPQAASPRERADMEKISARLLPAIARPHKGIKPEQLAAIRTTLAEFRIRRDGKRITGRPLDGGSVLKPDDAIAFWPYLKFCETVQKTYDQAKEPAEIAELGQIFIDLTEHFLDQGWRENSYMREGENYPGASADCFLRMRDVLATAGLARETALALLWTKACQTEGDYLAKEPWASMDGIGFWNNELAQFVMLLPDETERLHRLRIVQRFYNEALVNRATIAPDGCSYHHGMFHFAYASYNLPRVVRTLAAMKDTDFRLGPQAHERLKTYARAIASTFSASQQPYNLPARAGFPVNGNMAAFAQMLADLGTPDGKTFPDPEMVALAYSQILDKGAAGKAELEKEPMKSWIAAGAKPMDLSGFLPLNGSPLAVHRRPGWIVGIAGMSKYWRGLEIYGWTQQNNYARFARNSSISIVANGDPPNLAESGRNFDGWDWAHFPGSTSLQMNSQELFRGYAMFGNTSSTAGGTALAQDGVWGMDFSGDSTVAFRKSVFCFDNRLTVLTTGISAKLDNEAVTTLFQNRLQPGHETLSFDDGAEMKLPSERDLADGKARWIIDNQGNGYIIPAGQPALHIRCRPQEWTHMIRANLKDPKNDPFPDNKAYQSWNPAGKDLNALENHYQPTKADFAIAWFGHGSKPVDASCAYTIIVRTDAEAMRMLSRELPYEVLQQDDKVHAVKDLPSRTTGYVFYSANDAVAAPGVIAGTNLPAFLMVKETATGITLSAVKPGTDDPKPLALTLRGQWKSSAAHVSTTAAGGNTLVTLTTDYYMPLVVNLQKSN